MKSKLFLLFFFSVIFCSQPFLRKLEDKVTEESCKAQKKKYQAAVSAKCKIGNKEYEVEDEDDCVAGTWDSSKEGCTAEEITDKNKCTGIPEYTAGKDEVAAQCTLDGYGSITSFTDQNDCEKQLVWIDGLCDTTPAKQADCEDSSKWHSGICVDTSKASDSCDSLTSVAGVCVDTSQTADNCGEGLTSIAGVCSISEINSASQCTGKPKYSAAQAKVDPKCVFDNVELSDRETETKCTTPLQWLSGSCSNDLPVENENDCNTKGTFIAGTPAKCVDDDSDDDSKSTSSSNFIKAINFVLIAFCLLL